jgi:hypothetical protein
MVDHVVGCMDRHVPIGNSNVSEQPLNLVWMAAKLGGNHLRSDGYFFDPGISIFQTAVQSKINLLSMRKPRLV